MDADLLLQQQRYLRRLVRGLVKDEHAAEDLAQATWLAALRQPPRSDGTLPAWLARVARNLSRSHRRAEANEAARRRALAHERSWPPADEVAAELELAERVLAEVRALPEPLGATVHARYYEGLALEEIARRSGAPIATIRERLERARALLRQRLGPLGDERGLRGFLYAFLGRGAAWLEGGLLVKKLVALAALALIAFFVWRLSSGPTAATEAAPAAPLASAAAVVTPEVEPSAALPKPDAPAERASLASESEPSVVATTGSLLVAVTWPDGTPAERVLVRAWQDDDADLTRFARTQTTDATGSVRLTELAPGSYHVQLERERDGAACVVSAGEETSVALAVSSGPRVEGVVVDEEGAPVAGAGVWISTRYASAGEPSIDEALAAVTDPDGRFTIPSVGKAWLIGARAEGHAPSHEKSLTRYTQAKVEVRLVLPGPGGAIEGRVVDPEGIPIEGAAVVTDVGFRFERYPSGGLLIQNSLSLRTSSARDGSFRFTGVQPNHELLELYVFAPGHPVWSQEIEVSAGATTHVEARVSPGGSVRGRTLALDGTPLAGLLVVASIEPRTEAVEPDAPWVEQDWSQLLRASSERYVATRSRADGSYRLSGLPAGDSFVVAQTAGGGKAIEPLWLEPGEDLERDLELERGLELVCLLVDECGDPLVDQPVFVARLVDASEAANGSRGLFRTDEDGLLVVPNCADALYTLDIRARHHEEQRLPSPDATGLRPGPVEHRIVVANAQRPVAFARGIVLDDGGRPLAGARIDVGYGTGGSDRIASTGADGAFLSKGFRPGTSRIYVRAPDYPYLELAPREFAAGETTDMGCVTLRTPGFLKARLVRGDGGPVDDEHVIVELHLVDGSLWWSRVEVELGEALFEPTEPGSYTLKAMSSGCETVQVPVVIEAGVTKELDLFLPKTEPR